MARDEETGIEPKSQDGEGTDDNVRKLPTGSAKERALAEAQAALDGEDDDAAGESQTELPLDIPGAKKPSLTMNARGKPVSVEGKMRGKSFRMSGVVDDVDKVIEARVLIRFFKDQRVPVRDGSGETASTQSFVLRQEFDVLRMDIIEPAAAATGTDG